MPLFRRRRTERSSPPRATPGARPAPHARSYDAIADAFERHDAPHTAEVARDLIAALDPRPGDRVLDVGTGTGVVAQAARERVGGRGVVVGIDLSVEMLRIARRANRMRLAAAADSLDLPFRDATFDLEAANFVLSHFPRQDTALFDMRRVLRPGGKLGVTAWVPGNDEFDRAWNELAERYVGPEVLRAARKQIVPWEERLGDPATLKEVLYGAGFRRLHVDRRRYRFQWTRDGYLDNRIQIRGARYMRQLLGPALWERFQREVRSTFAERFPETFGDFREVLVATGVREE